MALSRLAGAAALGFVAIVLSTNAVLAAGHPPAGGTRRSPPRSALR